MPGDTPDALVAGVLHPAELLGEGMTAAGDPAPIPDEIPGEIPGEAKSLLSPPLCASCFSSCCTRSSIARLSAVSSCAQADARRRKESLWEGGAWGDEAFGANARPTVRVGRQPAAVQECVTEVVEARTDTREGADAGGGVSAEAGQGRMVLPF